MKPEACIKYFCYKYFTTLNKQKHRWKTDRRFFFLLKFVLKEREREREKHRMLEKLTAFPHKNSLFDVNGKRLGSK